MAGDRRVRVSESRRAESLGVRVRALVDECGTSIKDRADLESRGREIERVAFKWLESEVDRRFLEERLEEDAVYFVIGDLHGDYEALKAILLAAFPLDQPAADAEKTRLIFLGDLLDRGEMDFHVLHLVMRLHELLPGCVYQLRGNHEELVLEDDGTAGTNIAGDYHLFVEKYARRLPAETQQVLVRYFATLTHCLILRSDRGGIACVHAGVPPKFLLDRYPGDPIPKNLWNAFLWGRGPVDAPRPSQPYPYDSFYVEDVGDFCDRFRVALVLRGHDVQSRGYLLSGKGQCLTLFSSGTSISAPDRRGPYDEQVSLPRYLTLEPGRMFRSRREGGIHAGVDIGIGIKEVFVRDIVILLPAESLNGHDRALLSQIAARIHAIVRDKQNQPIRVIDRSGYTRSAGPVKATFPPLGGEFDPELDPSHRGRVAFELLRVGARVLFREWFPPERYSSAVRKTSIECEIDVTTSENLVKEYCDDAASLVLQALD